MSNFEQGPSKARKNVGRNPSRRQDSTDQVISIGSEHYGPRNTAAKTTGHSGRNPLENPTIDTLNVLPLSSNPKQNKAKSYLTNDFNRSSVRRERNDDLFPASRLSTGRITGPRHSGYYKSVKVIDTELDDLQDLDLIERRRSSSKILVKLPEDHERLVFRAARKMAAQPASKTPAPRTPPRHADESVPPDDKSDIYNQRDRNPSPSADLLEALEALTLSEFKLQKTHKLPFLVRNVREAFHARCKTLRIPTTLSASSYGRLTQARLLYKLGDEDEFMGRMVDWICPLCEVLGRFITREMLDAHLSWDHSECNFTWDMKNARGGVPLPLLTVVIPEPDELESESETSSTSSEDSVSSLLSPSSLRTSATPPHHHTDMYHAEIGDDALQRASSPAPKMSPLPEELPFTRAISIKTEVKSPSPEPLREPTPQLPVARPERPIDPTNPYRYPTPPPYDNLEGPSAIYPFIGPDRYSARPGGPKIYDLLDDLPLEQFGVMTWFVLDKEEEIFELDDVRDEDKVMQALWARWIIVNRTTFIKDYHLGTKRFIDDYWRMIHKAAGFSALRVWLLVLVANRFLTGSQFCQLLKYYSDLVGMDLWN